MSETLESRVAALEQRMDTVEKALALSPIPTDDVGAMAERLLTDAVRSAEANAKGRH